MTDSANRRAFLASCAGLGLSSTAESRDAGNGAGHVQCGRVRGAVRLRGLHAKPGGHAQYTNLTGQPAVIVPHGFNEKGQPTRRATHVRKDGGVALSSAAAPRRRAYDAGPSDSVGHPVDERAAERPRLCSHMPSTEAFGFVVRSQCDPRIRAGRNGCVGNDR